MLAPIVEIFCGIDDFCKGWFNEISSYLLPDPDRMRHKSCRLSASEIMTIVILFHRSHYRTFKDYYRDCVGMVETVIEQLNSICHIEHTRHRKPENFIVNLLAGLMAYMMKPRKPALKIDFLNEKPKLLMASRGYRNSLS